MDKIQQTHLLYLVLFSIMLIQQILNIMRIMQYSKYVKACREFLKSCSCAEKERPQDCKECTDAFVYHIQKLEQGEKISNNKVDIPDGMPAKLYICRWSEKLSDCPPPEECSRNKNGYCEIDEYKCDSICYEPQ